MKSWDRPNGKYMTWQFSTATSCLPLLFNTGIDWRMRQTRQLSEGLLEYHFTMRLNKPTGLDHTVWWEILINWLNIGDWCGRAVNNTSFIISMGKQVPANYQCPAPGWKQQSIKLLLWNHKLPSHCPRCWGSCWCGSSCCHGSGTASSPQTTRGVIPGWYPVQTTAWFVQQFIPKLSLARLVTSGRADKLSYNQPASHWLEICGCRHQFPTSICPYN